MLETRHALEKLLLLEASKENVVSSIKSPVETSQPKSEGELGCALAKHGQEIQFE